MFAPPCENLRVLRCAREYRFGRDRWGSIISGLDLSESACLSDKPWGTVWRVVADLPSGPTPLVMKVHAVRSPRDRLRSTLHLTRLCRQWRGSARLSRAGFPVAKCRALLCGVRDGHRLDVLVMDAADGRTLLDTIVRGGLTPAQDRTLAIRVGQLVTGLWNQGLHSKDLKPSNLLVGGTDEGGEPALTIIDTDAVGRRPAHPLLPLVLEPHGLGALPRRSMCWRALKAWAWNVWLSGPDEFGPIAGPGEKRDAPARSMETRIARRAWRDLERLVGAHGDARPVHNPIRAAAPLPGSEPSPIPGAEAPARSAVSG